MKKFILALILLLLPVLAMAHGTCTVTDVTSTQIASESNRIPDSVTVVITLVCTEDSDGDFTAKTVKMSGYYPTTSLNTYNLFGYYFYAVGRMPGNNSASVVSCTSTCPAANYTVTITDSRGFAIDLGLLTSNGSATASQLTLIVNTTTGYPVVRSDLVVLPSGITTSGAKVTLDLIFKAF
jgi:hypothetical protein